MMTATLPLFQFVWDGVDFDLGVGVRIASKPHEVVRAEFRDNFDEYISQQPLESSHVLEVDFTNCLGVDADEVGQLFLLALWCVRPHRLAIHWTLEAMEGRSSTALHLDQFQFNPLEPDTPISRSDLERARDVLPILASLWHAKQRLRSAIFLSIRGCEANATSVSALLHMSAIEAILTYRERRVTKHVATNFACLTSSAKATRDAAYCEMLKLYKYRSDIVHGRGYTYEGRGNENLLKLSAVDQALRKLWEIIVSKADLRNALECDDAAREVYFSPLVTGYTPPPQCP